MKAFISSLIEIMTLIAPIHIPIKSIILWRSFLNSPISFLNKLSYIYIGRMKAIAVQEKAPTRLINKSNLGTAIAINAMKAIKQDLSVIILRIGLPLMFGMSLYKLVASYASNTGMETTAMPVIKPNIKNRRVKSDS